MHWTNEQNESYRSFSDAAERYCTFVESLLEGRPEKFFEQLRSILSCLVWVTEDLRVKFIVTERIETSPTLDISDDDCFEPAIDFQAISSCLSKILSPEIERWEKIKDDTYQGEVERVCFLYDDLADLYEDLKTGLKIAGAEQDRPEHEAVFYWLVQAEYHWAPHLYTALLTVQELILATD